MAKLQDVVQQIRGVSYTPEDIRAVSDADAIALLRANNIQDGKLNFDDVVYIDKRKVKQAQYLKAGDILICASSGSKELVGKAAYVENDLPMTFGAFCKVARPQKGDAHYIGHYFESPYYRLRISEAAAGVNINNIRNEHIDVLDIPFPPINEQIHIASVLDKIGTLIDLHERLLVKLDKLVKARFVEMFGDLSVNDKKWAKAPLCQHADIITGYPFPSSDYSAEGIKIVGGYNLMQGFVQWTEAKYWPVLSGYEQYLLMDGDIVIAMDRPWVGNGFKIASIDNEHLPAILIQRTACIRAKDVKREFLYPMLDSDCFAVHCNIKGSLVPHISNKDINSYEIFIPPMELQERFSEFACQVNKMRLTMRQELDKMETLKRALMQEYFG